VNPKNSGTKWRLKILLGQEWDEIFNMAEADIKWFTNAKVNIVKTVSTAKKGDKTAIILNQMIQMKNLHISYNELYERVCKWQMS
jgi:acetyl-CoA synthetase